MNPNIKCITGHCKLKHTVLTVHIWICALLLLTLPETRRSENKNNQRSTKQESLARFRISLDSYMDIYCIYTYFTLDRI